MGGGRSGGGKLYYKLYSGLWAHPLGHGDGRARFFTHKLIVSVDAPRALGGQLHR